MNLPHDFATWTGLLKLILLLLPPGLLSGRLLWAISAHSVCLSGRRVAQDERPAILYRFAIQNNEDVPINGMGKLSIEILDSDGTFVSAMPTQVYAGCNAIRTMMDDRLRQWTMTFDELPAYETWTIECYTNSRAQNLRLAIERVDATEQNASNNNNSKDTGQSGNAQPLQATLRLPRLSHSTLALPANKSSVFVGRRTTPEAWWAATAVILALGGYVVAFYYLVYRVYEHIGLEEAIAPLSIIGFGFALWWLTRRPAPSISQGYWAVTPGAPQDGSGLYKAARAAGELTDALDESGLIV